MTKKVTEAKQKPSYKVDVVAGILGGLITWVGAGSLYAELKTDSTNWGISLGIVIFGSMIMGVALHKLSLTLQKGRK